MDSLTATDLRTVGEFRLLARLGAGGMGQVFLGSSLAGRMVAVKIIHTELCRDPEFVRRFRKEVESAQKVSGWYTAPVVAAGVDDNPPWLATAFVSGPSLDDMVSKHGPLPTPALWRLAAGLAEALRAIHGTGLVHRDLKPANVMLAIDGPRVIDFGISRAVTETRLTATGAIIGTPSYMSPEQVQALVAGPASDTFSLGSVLAFAASGTTPFSGDPDAPPTGVMYRIAHGEPDLSAVPSGIRGLVEACLAKDPQQRPDLGQVAAHSTATVERLGLSPATFWPDEVARVIEAQQAALTAEIRALQLSPSTQVEGAWRGNSVVTDPSRGGGAASAGGGSALAGGGPASGPQDGPTDPGPTAVLGNTAIIRGPSRRGLLIGGGVGGIAVIGGAVGWVLSSSSSTGTPTAKVGHTPAASAPAQPTSSALQQYYGTGTRRTATWKFPTGNAVNADPSAANGLVFVGSTDNRVYAVHLTTGNKAWSYPAGTVTAPPEVVGDVVCLSTNLGQFYALRVADGTRAWALATSIPAEYKRTWASHGDSVILSTATTSPQVYDAATGAKGMRFNLPNSYALALSAADGVLYALDLYGKLHAFDIATGTETWHQPVLSSNQQPVTGLTVGGGSLYLGTTAGALLSISTASGKVNWTYHPGSSMLANAVVADGLVYINDYKGIVHAVSADTGKQVWHRIGVATGTGGVAVAGGRVYYSTSLAIQALNAQTGAPVWAFTTPGGAAASGEFLGTPAVADGLVCVGCYDNALYAIKA